MAIFRTQQNRQFYVVTTEKKDLAKAVSTKAEGLEEGNFEILDPLNGDFMVKHFGKGGLTRTDILPKGQICYAKYAPKEAMQRLPKKATLTLNEIFEGNVIPGQDYIVRVHINNYLAPGDANVLVKVGAVHAFKGMKPAGLYKSMAESLNLAFKREQGNLLKITSDDNGVYFEEVADQPWRLGVLSQEPVNFEVFPTTVTLDGDNVIWGKVTPSEGTEPIGNGKKIADLEYFCMGERGDVFRNMGWPNNIDVKYMVNPEEEYNILDIHYYWSGEGVDLHKSEKDITFVSTSTEGLEAIKNALKKIGVDIHNVAADGTVTVDKGE